MAPPVKICSESIKVNSIKVQDNEGDQLRGPNGEMILDGDDDVIITIIDKAAQKKASEIKMTVDEYSTTTDFDCGGGRQKEGTYEYVGVGLGIFSQRYVRLMDHLLLAGKNPIPSEELAYKVYYEKFYFLPQEEREKMAAQIIEVDRKIAKTTDLEESYYTLNAQKKDIFESVRERKTQYDEITSKIHNLSDKEKRQVVDRIIMLDNEIQLAKQDGNDGQIKHLETKREELLLYNGYLSDFYKLSKYERIEIANDLLRLKRESSQAHKAFDDALDASGADLRSEVGNSLWNDYSKIWTELDRKHELLYYDAQARSKHPHGLSDEERNGVIASIKIRDVRDNYKSVVDAQDMPTRMKAEEELHEATIEAMKYGYTRSEIETEIKKAHAAIVYNAMVEGSTIQHKDKLMLDL